MQPKHPCENAAMVVESSSTDDVRHTMGTSSPCLKVMLILINFVFLLGGLGLVAAGGYAILAPAYLLQLLGSHLLRNLASLFVVVGCFVLLFSFLGCCGAKFENKCLLVVYMILIFIVFCILIGCLIYLLTRQEEVRLAGAAIMRTGLKKHYGFNNSFTNLMDRFQSDIRCCGLWSSQARELYESSRWYRSQPEDSGRILLPVSCCIKNPAGGYMSKAQCQKDRGTTALSNRYHHQKGCMNAVWEMWTKYRSYIVGSGAGVLFILFCLFFTTFFFVCQIKRTSSHGGIHV